MIESEDRAMFVILLFACFVVIAIMGAVIASDSKEIRILKARCVKTGVATMTYDLNTGEEKFIFEVPNEK